MKWKRVIRKSLKGIRKAKRNFEKGQFSPSFRKHLHRLEGFQSVVHSGQLERTISSVKQHLKGLELREQEDAIISIIGEDVPFHSLVRDETATGKMEFPENLDYSVRKRDVLRRYLSGIEVLRESRKDFSQWRAILQEINQLKALESFLPPGKDLKQQRKRLKKALRNLKEWRSREWVLENYSNEKFPGLYTEGLRFLVKARKKLQLV